MPWVCSVCRIPYPDDTAGCSRCGERGPLASLGHCPTDEPKSAVEMSPLEALGLQSLGEVATDDSSAEELRVEEPAPPAAAPPAPEDDCLLQLRERGTFATHRLRHPYYSVGRGRTRITLNDESVSRRHLTLARVGDRWLVINVSTSKRLRVNGTKTRQHYLSNGDVIHIGHTRLVFVDTGGERAAEARRPMRGAAARIQETLPSEEESDGTAALTVGESGWTLASSTGVPLLIGADPRCHVHHQGPDVRPFHCQLAWTAEGPKVFDLGSGTATFLDGHPVREERLRDGQTLGVGSALLTIGLSGAPTPRVDPPPHPVKALSLTVLYGSHRGETTLMPEGNPLTFGRGPEADLALSGEKWLSPVELELSPQSDPLGVRVRRRAEGTRIVLRGHRLKDEALAAPGDVLQFGLPPFQSMKLALLIHE